MGLQTNPILPQERRQDEPANQPTSDTHQTPHPTRYPQHIWQQLDGHDIRIIEEIDYLSRLQAKKSPTGARYCCPSEEYLAKKAGVRREAISRHVTKLGKLGILSVTPRRKKGGYWQTNLYKLVKWAAWKIREALAPLHRSFHRVRLDAHKAIPMREIKSQPEKGGGPTGIKSTLLKLFAKVQRGEPLGES